jgi:hypothetical protein
MYRFLSRISLMAVSLLLPSLSSAAIVTIIDLTEGNPAVIVSGFDPTSLIQQLSPESVDLHGEYLSTLSLPNGAVVTVDFDFLEPPGEPGSLLVSSATR